MSKALVPIPAADIAKWGESFGATLVRVDEIRKADHRLADLEHGAPVITNQLEADLALERMKDLRLGERAVKKAEDEADMLRVAKLLAAAVKEQTKPRAEKYAAAFAAWKRAVDAWNAEQARKVAEDARKAREAAAAAVEAQRAAQASDDIPEISAVPVPKIETVMRANPEQKGGTALWQTSKLSCEMLDPKACVEHDPSLVKLDSAMALASYRALVKQYGEKGVAEMGQEPPHGLPGVVIGGVRYWHEVGSAFRA
ncbi:MAG: hypothetical protein ACKVW3_01795 [Phycisphaerales bacterium]